MSITLLALTCAVVFAQSLRLGLIMTLMLSVVGSMFDMPSLRRPELWEVISK
jgi:hypothetical protein